MAPELLGSNLLWLAVAIGTHAVVGFALGAALFGRPRAGAIAAVVADVDLLFPGPDGTPLGHRGVTHSGLALGIAVAIALYWGRDVAGAVAAGYGSQLAIDATTPKGIPIAFPLSTENVGVSWNLHGDVATVALLVASAAVLAWTYREELQGRVDGGSGRLGRS